jgi:integrase/recombinase XerD
MRTLKHLPLDQWPDADIQAFEAAYAPGDIFDETNGPGAHLAEGTRQKIETAYRRWLGYLDLSYRADLRLSPPARITPIRVRTYIEQISTEVRATTVATNIYDLYYAARLIAPNEDWRWLKAIHSRLAARAKPLDRFNQLVPARQTLDLGIALMDEAIDLPPDAHHRREFRYRNGLILVLLSLWPIRRRSIAAITLTNHVKLDEDGVTLLLYRQDTKSKRQEHYSVPDHLTPYFKRYLKEIRQNIPGAARHDGLWASNKACPLSESGIYDIVRRCTGQKFGKPMGLHNFRRAAATYLAMDEPDMAGLIPGVLQHSSPEVSEKHYNLARSIKASRRHTATIEELRAELGPPSILRKE